MAEAARRTGYGHGSDVVRRLIARPIRLQAAAVALPTMVTLEPADSADSADLAEPESRDETAPFVDETDAAPSDIARIRTEMVLLKAVLQAARDENASLRACVGLDEAEDTLGEEARAVRARWVTLVDRLLHAPA